MPLLSPALPLLSPQTDGQKRRYSKKEILIRLNYCIASSGLSMIVAEQPTAALSTSHLTAVAPKVWFRDDELVGETLMIAFVMVMGQVLLERIVQKVFSQYNPTTSLVEHALLSQRFMGA
jgi:hypothetical protein